MSGEEHWNEVYAGRDPESLGWYEPVPSTLEQLLEAAGGTEASIIDVGAGASTLVDHLLERGFDDVTLLDVAGEGLAVTRRRLGARADAVDFVVADVTRFTPLRRWDVWHDRAVFHFLTEPDARQRYLAALDAALVGGGYAVIATFAPDGPDRCAGLPVERYSPEALAEAFAPVLDVVACEYPAPAPAPGDRRPYVVCRFVRRPAATDIEPDEMLSRA